MEQAIDLERAARSLLFRDAPVQAIPGKGTSAAKTPLRHSRVKITINLDADLVDGFKKKASGLGIGYQVLINQALREHLEGDSLECLVKEVGTELLENESFIESLSQLIKSTK